MLESSGICRNGREANAKKMLEKWPMTVAARIDDTPVLFKFFLYQKNQVRVVFHSRVKSIGKK